MPISKERRKGLKLWAQRVSDGQTNHVLVGQDVLRLLAAYDEQAARLATAVKALELLHGKAQVGVIAYPDSMKGCWSEVMFGTIRNTARIALDKIKESANENR